ncbi:Type 1 phosphatases regulator ypi1 [Kalmusia sp. IMI 367209]|nr:Type 1 phosphatases regulator ypi1 [Kalmusia sp. IMI 367209]
MSNPNNMGTFTATPASGSRTIEARPQPVLRLSAPSGTLRLRAEPAEQRHIQWASDVVDNEGMGKKSSKVCCIYHKPREVGESSDESSSDSSSDEDSDSEPDNSTARPVGGRKSGRRGRKPHGHDHDHDGHEHDHGNGEGSSGKSQKRQRRKPSPNAYEKMPKQRK